MLINNEINKDQLPNDMKQTSFPPFGRVRVGFKVVSNMHSTILAGGDFPTHSIPLEALRNPDFLCCCDGAAQSAIANGLHPDAIIGDGDSLLPELKEKYKDIFHQVSEQEDNDLTKATRFCISHGFTDITYIAATGKREDHTLGNIFLLPRYLCDFGIRPLMLTDYGSFRPASGTHTFSSFPRQQVSIFNISCSEIRSEGLRWDSYSYSQLWQGTLNEATGNEFTLHADGTYIVFQTYEAK